MLSNARLGHDDEGWFPAEDIATVDEAGYLFITGRFDHIRGGENIAPAELEDVLVEHPHVHEVAVGGVEDPQWGQAIVAVVVPAAGVDPDTDELPTNASGKLLRRGIIESLRDANADK